MAGGYVWEEAESRRRRVLVVRSAAVLGNYDYVFDWIRSAAHHQVALAPAFGIFREMPPGYIAGFALEHAQNIRHTLGTSLVVGDQSIDVHSVVRTIQPTQQRLRKTSGIELAGVEEIAAAPVE